jgi:hypothetical protein
MGIDGRARQCPSLQNPFCLIRNFSYYSTASIIPQIHEEGTGGKDLVNGTINDKRNNTLSKSGMIRYDLQGY